MTITYPPETPLPLAMAVSFDRLKNDPVYFARVCGFDAAPWQREAMRRILSLPTPECNCHERDSTYHHLCPLCGPEMREDGIEDPE